MHSTYVNEYRCIHRVSSVLNKDNKNYGKKNLIDGSEETCWNSEAVSCSNLCICRYD